MFKSFRFNPKMFFCLTWCPWCPWWLNMFFLQFFQYFFRRFPVVKMMFHFTDNLISLMSFARDQNQISRSRVGQSQTDRLFAVLFHPNPALVALKQGAGYAPQNIFQNHFAVFGARVIGGDNR